MGVLKYSVKALKAIPRFFAYRNAVDIYTEDRVADKEFYKSLFKRLLGDTGINDVTPLGCKANVLSAYDTQDKTDGRRKYYIVDGDLDLIIGTNRKEEGNLIVLDSYCIENYIIDEAAAIELLYYSSGTEDRDKIRTRLNFNR